MKQLIYDSHILESMFRSAMEHYRHYYWAVYYVSGEKGFDLFNRLKAQKEKICAIYVSCIPWSNNPYYCPFYNEFKEHPNIHFVSGRPPQWERGLHTKTYLFYNTDEDWCCFIGSANFTKAAMSLHRESTLCFDSSSDVDGSIIRDLKHFFNETLPRHQLLIDTNHKKNKNETVV